MSTKRKTASEKAETKLRDLALRYPESHEDFPWGSRAIKVRGKIFFTVNHTEEGLVVTVKLPESNAIALAMEGAEPTHYGMGKHGWVTFRWGSDEAPPTDLIEEFMDESFRAIAPKKLVAQLDAES